jgi:hypothetical protein
LVLAGVLEAISEPTLPSRPGVGAEVVEEGVLQLQGLREQARSVMFG